VTPPLVFRRPALTLVLPGLLLLVRRLHRGLRLPIKSFNCSGACHGTMTEWFNAGFPGVAITVEYGRRVSRQQATRTGPTGLL